MKKKTHIDLSETVHLAGVELELALFESFPHGSFFDYFSNWEITDFFAK